MTQGKRILIVEDEVKIADTLKLGLSENGYLVDVAYDGKAGIKLFETHSYNLVILDINIPGINGYQLCKIMRSNNSQVPIIMLTALSSLDHKVEGYDAGADDYVVKPFEFKELCMKIRVLLKRTLSNKLVAGNVLKAADLEMNLDSKEIKRGNVAINLTAKEFQLLEYLLRNKNRVVSRADIAVNVWDIDF
ncbi:MAG: response regulator transcription factor, partial [Chitinophagaceae bacterium]